MSTVGGDHRVAGKKRVSCITFLQSRDGRLVPHSSQDLLDRGLEQEPLSGYDPAVHQDREFAPVPVHQFHLDVRFLPQGRRQTGGVFADPASDGALPDCHLFHHARSFQ